MTGQPPAAAMVWPGVCHNLEIAGHPHAGEVTLTNGIPTGELFLGADLAGHPVAVEITSLTELSELALAVQTLAARLSMWLPRTQVHPFGDEADAA